METTTIPEPKTEPEPVEPDPVEPDDDGDDASDNGDGDTA